MEGVLTNTPPGGKSGALAKFLQKDLIITIIHVILFLGDIMKTIYMSKKEALKRLSIYLAKNYNEIINDYSGDNYSLDIHFYLLSERRPAIDIDAICDTVFEVHGIKRYGSENVLLGTIFLDDVDGISEEHEIVISDDKNDNQDLSNS